MATKEEIAQNLADLTTGLNELGKALSHQIEQVTTLVSNLSDRVGDLELSQAGTKQQVSEVFHSMTVTLGKLQDKLAAPTPPPAASPHALSGGASVTFNIPIAQVLKALIPESSDPNVVALAINPADPNVLSLKEQQFIKSNQKLNAIKEYRGRTGVGLKEAKDAVEAWMIKNGIQHCAL